MANVNARSSREGRGAWQSTRPIHRVFLRRLSYVVLIIVGLLFGGFLRFADTVAGLLPPEKPKADAVVVLTGGTQRIDQAVNLLETGTGQRLLISGVHPDTSAARIREMTRAPQSLFVCCVDLGYDAIDTVGNALETAKWVRAHKYRRVLVVTSNYHMPRSLLELHRIDPETQYVGYPIVYTDLKSENWMAMPEVVKAMVSEYVKLVGATIRAHLFTPDTSSLRSGKGER
ncbi:YdcF family protein [Rhizobium sp. C4]|uniref:YdcF family protein n=1 Tax=Rhizobium sp. C4 TaxID=1349800 RepID=UPI001E2EAEE6|nr:YdcF family protein [Rhizobium sp. C4]MCD2175689.1 YdcF family protein [Rhizobium sp. C4]